MPQAVSLDTGDRQRLHFLYRGGRYSHVNRYYFIALFLDILRCEETREKIHPYVWQRYLM